MTQQVKPEQIKARIEAIANEARAKGYKSGWAWHQMDNLVQVRWLQVQPYTSGGSSYLPQAAQSVAENASNLTQIMERIEEDYEQYMRYEAEYGN